MLVTPSGTTKVLIFDDAKARFPIVLNEVGSETDKSVWSIPSKALLSIVVIPSGIVTEES